LVARVSNSWNSGGGISACSLTVSASTPSFAARFARREKPVSKKARATIAGDAARNVAIAALYEHVGDRLAERRPRRDGSQISAHRLSATWVIRDFAVPVADSAVPVTRISP